MKNMRKPIALLMAIVMIISVMTTSVFAGATGTGDISDPIVCDAIADMPATVTIPAGGIIYYTVPAGGMELTVVDDTTATNIVGPMGNTLSYTSNGMGVASVVFEEYAAGDVVKFGLWNQNPHADVTVQITIGEPAPAAVGTEENPANANDFYNSLNKYFILNPQLEAGDKDGYWCQFKADKNGILSLENSSADGAEYQIMVDDGKTQYLAVDGVYSNPISTYRLTRGDIVKINIRAEYDENNEIPATKVYASFKLISGSTIDPVSIKSEGYKAFVKSGDTVCYTDSTRTAAYCGKGLVITGYTDAIAETKVMIGTAVYTDTDGDGKIEINIGGDYYSRPFIEITNNYKWDIAYTFTITDTAKEGAYCSCGKALDHIEAAESCHAAGTLEYWYCASCDAVYADAAATQVTNRLNLMVPSINELIHIEAVEPGCHYDGNIEYWYCDDCGYYYLDAEGVMSANAKSVILPAKGAEVIHFEAVEPGCHYNGNIEYWYCPECEQFWADEALTQLTNSKNVIVPATGEGNLVHFDAVEPGCHYNGNIEYWVCYDCEQVWEDENHTRITNIKNVVLPAKGSENLQHVEAKAPTCYEEGNIEYWYCPDCEQFWQDEALTQITNSKSVILPVIHTNVVHFDAVEADCHYNGNVEYWVCYDCEQVWADEALTQLTNIKNVVIPATGEGNLVHFDAVEAGCHYEGNIEYWVCYDCEQVWTDEALTQLTNIKNVVLPATGSEDVVHFDAVEPGCHYNGNIEYWFCAECQQFWTDEALTQITNSKNVIVPATGSENLQHVEAVAPTCIGEGNVEYWYCADCYQFWTDEALTQITNSKSVILPATGEHVWADDFTIDREPADGEDGEKSKHCTIEGCDARTEITVIPDHIVGDVDEDGVVTASDITAVIKHMKGAEEYANADVDGDGVVTASDITAVIKIMKA